MIKYAAIAAVLISVLTGVYMKGRYDSRMEMAAEYAKELEKVVIGREKLAKTLNKSEAEYIDEAFAYEDRIDTLVGNVRTERVRVYIKPKTSVSKDESAKCDIHAENGTELDAEIVGGLTELTSEGDRAIRLLGLCQNYILENRKVINRE